MGTIRNGANIGFSEKAGSSIGSSWLSISYIKGRPELSKRYKSEKQLYQQARFAKAIRFFFPVKDYVKVGFKDQKQGRSTGFNVALKTLLIKAMKGVYPAIEIDYTLAEFARGPISAPASVVVSPKIRKLGISWATDVLKFSGNCDDEFIVLVYDPNSNDYVVGPSGALRSSGRVEVVTPSDWAGLAVYVYVYFISKNREKVSNSIYAGTATLL